MRTDQFVGYGSADAAARACDKGVKAFEAEE